MAATKLITLRPADDWILLQSLGDKLGLQTTGMLRMGLRMLVSGVSPVDRYLFERHCSRRYPLDRRSTTMRANQKDLEIISALRQELGKGVGLSALCRCAIRALARKEGLLDAPAPAEQPPAVAMVPVEKPARTADYLTLQPKLCETCGKQFLRVVGEKDNLCSNCEARIAAAAERTEKPEKARATENIENVFDPSPFSVSAPARAKIPRKTSGDGMTIVRSNRRREASALENGILTARA
jgi:ribosomal protein L37AE/L43A